MSGFWGCRQLAAALTARATLRIGEGKADDAWTDLLTCHRLARLMGHCATLIEGMGAMAIEGFTLKADVAYIERASLTALRSGND